MPVQRRVSKKKKTTRRALASRTDVLDALRDSEERLRRLISNAPVILWSMDANGIITRSEGKALAAIGLRPNEIVGRSFFELYPTAADEGRRALAGEEIVTQGTLGKTSFETRYSPVLDAKGRVTGVIGVTLDITERVEMAERLRKLSRRLLAVQEEERRRIAREIHDEVGQTLTALKLNLDLALRERIAAKMTARLTEASGFAARVLDELRRIAHDLQPGSLDQLGLKASLRALCRSFEKKTGVECTASVELSRGVPLDAESTIFRFVQEALTNAARHARARTVSLKVEQKRANLVASVADDGVGFDLDVLDGDGLGLAGMRERARILGGELIVDSSRGRGTRLQLSLPVTGT